jgi:capsular polysaccharide biosynthesis protein
MKNLISVPLPLNMSSAESDLYISYNTYEFPSQKIRYLKNVLITFFGFCINRNGLIRECHHNYSVQLESYLAEASEYYYQVVDDPEKLITLDNDTNYLVIHHPWFNYYHWVCESIFRLWLVRRKLAFLTLVLPEYYKNADFITGSLEPFNLENILYIPNEKSLLVRNLVLPQLKPICDAYNSHHIRQVRNFYRDYVLNKKGFRVEKGERLYISRKLAARRKVINEDEILSILYKYDFSIFYPEKHSFLEQVAIFSNIEYLVGEHGSALTNMLFMDKNASVLEIHKNKTNELNHPSFLFWYMAESLEVNYYHQSCETSGKVDYFDGDYIIEPKLFERNIVTMISKG